MMMSDMFVLSWFTTAKMVDGSRLLSFIRGLKPAVGAERIPGEWIRQNDENACEFSDVESFVEQGMPEWKGLLTIAIGDDDAGWSGGIELLRLPRGRSKSPSGQDADYRCHRVTIEFQPGFLRGRMGEAELLGLLADSAKALEAELAIGNRDDGFIQSLHAFRGLEAGLPGVYQMMVLGPAFTAIIPEKRLDAIRVPGKFWLERRWFAFQAPAVDEVTRVKMELREEIGSEYFADLSVSKESLSEGGQIGLFSFVAAMLRSKRDFESTTRLAAIRPSIDWSGVFVGHDS